MMKVNKWTLGLAAVGLVTLPAVMQAEEKMAALNTALSSTTISGYVNAGAQWTIGSAHYGGNAGGQVPGGHAPAFNTFPGLYDSCYSTKSFAAGANGGTTPSYLPPGYAFNTPSKQDGFNLNVVNVVIEKPLDAQDNWAAGYKIDMLYGPDAVGWNPSPGAANSDFGLKQAYVALRAPVGNGLDMKLGTFDTIIGYETYNAGNNPNYTRSYGYTMEPTEHTGLLLSYQFSKSVGVAAGIANTWNAGINNRAWANDWTRSETYKTYMAALTLTAPDSWGSLAGSTLYGGAVNGFDTGATADNNTSLYAGATINTPLKGLRVGLAYDYRGTHATPNTNVGRTWADAAAVYLSYQATEKLSLHTRVEYAWMDESFSGGNIPAKTFAVTATVQYDLWANVLSRLEFRWDHAADGSQPYYDLDRNSMLVALNIIYKF